MKELSIEEKARRYDEAINRIKHYVVDEYGCSRIKVADVFSELSESEDERIRKAIIHLVNKSYEQGGYALHKDEAESMISWLEKQGEHANFRNKIQIGDKVTRNEAGVLVNISQLNRIAKPRKQDEQKIPDVAIVRKELNEHLKPQVRTGLEWVNTIDDACDKRYSEEYAHGEYCHEQSFKWGFQEGVDWLEKQGEPKQDVLEKLEEWLDEYVSDLADVDTTSLICSFTNYLDGKLPKSLRHRSHWKPTDEQMKALSDINVTGGISYVGQGQELINLYNELKKLKS